MDSHFYYYGYKKIRARQYRQDSVLFAWKIGAVQIHATPQDSALLSVSRRENPKGKKREKGNTSNRTAAPAERLLTSQNNQQNEKVTGILFKCGSEDGK